jgi:V-type H+-transporting ATPase subunit a
LYIPYEISQATVAELGELGQLQLIDMNVKTNAFQRTFVDEVKRLNEMERRLRFVTLQAEKCGIVVKPSDPLAPYASIRTQNSIEHIDQTLGSLERRLLDMNSSEETLNKRYLELSEQRHVLRETAAFFQTVTVNLCRAKLA